MQGKLLPTLGTQAHTQTKDSSIPPPTATLVFHPRVEGDQPKAEVHAVHCPSV